MSKNKHGPDASRAFRHATCGKVEIDFNQEDEVKTRIVTPENFPGHEDDALDALWQAYKAEKTAEWRKSFDRHFITRANGRKLMTPLHMENKPYRMRTFQTVASSHPSEVEIRVEGLVTMIKIATPRKDKSSVLRRMEVRIRQQFPGQVEFSEIPGEVGETLSAQFNRKQHRFAAAMSESSREKITVPMMFEWKGDGYVFAYERAKDLGVLRSMAGHEFDITEYEGEVKKLFRLDDYVRGEPVDLKDAPDYADLSDKDVKVMIDGFLHTRLERFLEFSNNWLDMNGYKGCRLEPVTMSKSQPAIDALHELLKNAPDRIARKATRAAIKRGKFEVDPALNGLRLQAI